MNVVRAYTKTNVEQRWASVKQSNHKKTGTKKKWEKKMKLLRDYGRDRHRQTSDFSCPSFQQITSCAAQTHLHSLYWIFISAQSYHAFDVVFVISEPLKKKKRFQQTGLTDKNVGCVFFFKNEVGDLSNLLRLCYSVWTGNAGNASF